MIWDNARVLHKAAELSPGLPRVLHRTTTAGGVPQPAMVRGTALPHFRWRILGPDQSDADLVVNRFRCSQFTLLRNEGRIEPMEPPP